MTASASHLERRHRSGGGNGGLPVGISQIWLCMVSTSFELDYFFMTVDSTVSPPPAPTPAPTPAEGAYGGVPASIPGTIEAEEFDEGGEGVGYEDSTAGNVMGVGSSG